MPTATFSCGCILAEGRWWPCVQHPEECERCHMPTAAGSQGLCVDCLLEVAA